MRRNEQGKVYWIEEPSTAWSVRAEWIEGNEPSASTENARDVLKQFWSRLWLFLCFVVFYLKIMAEKYGKEHIFYRLPTTVQKPLDSADCSAIPQRLRHVHTWKAIKIVIFSFFRFSSPSPVRKNKMRNDVFYLVAGIVSASLFSFLQAVSTRWWWWLCWCWWWWWRRSLSSSCWIKNVVVEFRLIRRVASTSIITGAAANLLLLLSNLWCCCCYCWSENFEWLAGSPPPSPPGRSTGRKNNENNHHQASGGWKLIGQVVAKDRRLTVSLS